MFNATVLSYNAFDVINTAEVDENISAIMTDNYNFQYNIARRLIEPLMFMMSRGVNISFEALQETKEQCKLEIARKQAKLNELAGGELNINSSKQLKTYFYVTKGCKPYTKRNAKGGSSVTCDDKALQRLARGTASQPGLYEAKLIQEIRGLSKLVSTYLDLTLDEDKRFRCSYNPVGTRFGRLSSSKTIFGTGMNMQNLPIQFKKFLIADPGCMMWEIDKSAAEWVVVAYLSGDPSMIKVIEEGLDAHIHTAHLMTGIDKEILMLDEKRIGHESDPEQIARIRKKMCEESAVIADTFEKANLIPRSMSFRQCGKKSNHGLNYDEGYKTFALTNEMLEADAKKVITLYRTKAYPGIPLWHKATVAKLQKDRTLTNCFGRTYKFIGAWDDNLFKAAYSFVPQSTVADLVNKGIIATYEDTREVLAHLEMLGQVHDSIMGQHSETFSMRWMATALLRVAQYINSEMEYGGRIFTIGNDAKAGYSWSDLKEVDINGTPEKLAKELRRIRDESTSSL